MSISEDTIEDIVRRMGKQEGDLLAEDRDRSLQGLGQKICSWLHEWLSGLEYLEHGKAVWGVEVLKNRTTGEQKNLHIGGACYFDRPKKKQQLLDETRWKCMNYLKPMQYKYKQSVAYCTKITKQSEDGWDSMNLGDPWYIGDQEADVPEHKEEGEMSKTEKFGRLVRDGATDAQLIQDGNIGTFMMRANSITKIRDIVKTLQPRIRKERHTEVIWGAGGHGKSYMAGDKKPDTLKCVFGQDNGTDVIRCVGAYDPSKHTRFLFDDVILPSFAAFKALIPSKDSPMSLRLPYTGMIEVWPEEIFFTSNNAPETWWAEEWRKDPDAQVQFERRLSIITELKTNFNPAGASKGVCTKRIL